MSGLILVAVYLAIVLGIIFALAGHSDRRRKKEMEWYHETMERIAGKEEKKERR